MRWMCLVVAGIFAFAPATAWGQDSGAVADSLYREGKRLFDAKKFSDACPKLEESLRLDPESGGAQLMLADCLEQTGKLARAWSAYLSAQRLAKAAGRDDRLVKAEGGAKRMEERVPFVSVRVPANADIEGLRVRINGIELGRGAWGTPTPVDPGPVMVEATAPAHATFAARLTLAPGSGTREVVISPLAPSPTSEPSAPPSALAPAASAPRAADRGDAPRETRHESTGAPVAGYVIGGLGLVAIGAGAYYGISSLQTQSDADAKCPKQDCTDPDAVALSKDAKTQGTVAWVLLGAGSAAVTVGAILVLSGGSSSRARAARPRAGVAFDGRSLAATLGASF